MGGSILPMEDGDIEMNAVRQVLDRTGMTVECALMVRKDRHGQERKVAYYVPAPRCTEDKLRAALAEELPGAAQDLMLAAVSSLPLDSQGRVDAARLEPIAVIDPDLVRQWELELQGQYGMNGVSVLVQDMRQDPEMLHLRDLLPGESASGGALESIATPFSAALDEGAKQQLYQQGLQGQRPAISHGPELIQVQGAARTLIQSLQQAAQADPGQGILYVYADGQEVFQSYAELLYEARCVLAGLRCAHLQPQDKAIFQFSDNRHFLTAFWGCMLGGIIPVPLGVALDYSKRNAAVNKLVDTWEMLGRPAVLTSSRLAPHIDTLSRSIHLDGLRVHVFEKMIGEKPADDIHTSDPGDVALLMMTSGSTGKPKGVMLRHNNLLSRSAGSIQMNGFSSQDVSLNWMPLDHVAGIIYFHLRDIALACRQIQVPTEIILQEPLKWLDLIQRHRATLTFAPNFAFGLINDQVDEIRQRSWDLSSLQRILNGAEAIVARTARTFMRLLIPHGLPASAMWPVWGMSEISSGVTYSNNFSLETTSDDDPFVEVGAPIPGFHMRIVNRTGKILNEGQIGSLEVKGETLMKGYYGRPDLDQEVFTADGWFITGDLGYLRNGCLTITGREKDVIIINSVNYYSHEIEGVVEQIDAIATSYTAACAVRDPNGETDKLAIFFHTPLTSGPELLELFKRIRRRVVAHIGISPHFLLPVDKTQIPKTEIGKIQRSKLALEFQKGTFNEILKQVDLLTANSNTLPNWFLKPTWHVRRTNPAGGPAVPGCNLVFMDQAGLGERLTERLAADGEHVIGAAVGADFARVNEKEYTLQLGNEAHCSRLLQELRTRFGNIARIFYLWPYESHRDLPDNEAQMEALLDHSLFGLLGLVKALAEAGETPNKIALIVVSSDAQYVHDDDAPVWPKALLQGFVTTISRENPWVTCRLIDLRVGTADADAVLVIQESRCSEPEQSVAFRGGDRYVWRLEPVDFEKNGNRPLPFRQGGMYLISGGLGSIGIEIGAFLLKHFEAKLLLLGRSPLVDAVHLKGRGPKERARALDRLKQMAGSVRYAAVDVCDREGLRRAVVQGETEWGCRLDGIIHLAGSFHEKPLAEETRESMIEILRPKIFGSWALHQLLEDRPGSLFISFGSVNGQLGGFMVGAYAAANSFLDSFAQYQREQAGLQSYALSWSMWDEVGMSRRYAMKDMARKRGFYLMRAQQALNSWLACLHHAQWRCCIGLDPARPEIARLSTAGPAAARQCVVCYLDAFDPAIRDRLRREVLLDPFGTICPTTFQRMEDFPLTANGMPDRFALALQLEQGLARTAEARAPESEAEKIIAQVWQDVLQQEIHGVEANFFDLGGSSLLMAKVNGMLKKRLQYNIGMTELFRFPTISSLARYLAAGVQAGEKAELAASKHKGSERRSRMLRRRKEADREKAGVDVKLS
jgi:acyl-CoA synthetase (AMP-forming)/AMP-acid ligase II